MNNSGSYIIPTIAGIATTGGTATIIAAANASGAATSIAAATHGIGILSLSAAGGGTVTAIAVSPVLAAVVVPAAVVAGIFAIWKIFTD